MTGRIRFGDEGERYLTAQSLVERRDFAIRIQPDLHRKIGLDGRNYSSYELGSILPLVPFYALGRLVAQQFPLDDLNAIAMLITGLFNPLITALTVWLLYKSSRVLTESQNASLAVAFLFGLGTIAMPYSRAFEREALLTIFLLFSIYTAGKFFRTNRLKWLLATGLSVALLCFTKIANTILLPLFIIYLVWVLWRDRRASIGRVLFDLMLFGIPVVLLVGVQAVFNYMRFGSFTDIGLVGTWGNPLSYFAFDHIGAALAGIFFSPTKSIFLFSPPILLAIPAWIHFVKECKPTALLVSLLITANILFNAMNVNWDQPSWWGPKYLVAMTPLFLLPVGLLYAHAHKPKRIWVTLTWLTGLAGLCIQIIGTLVDDREHLDIFGRGIDLVGALNMFSRGAFDSLVLYLSPEGFPVRINPFGILIIAVILFLAGLIVVRWRQGEEAYASWRANGVFLTGILLIEAFGFITWIVAPYSQVVATKGDTRYVAANNFLAEGKQCEAIGFYAQALARETHYQAQAAARLEQLWQPAQGKRIPISNPTMWIDAEGEASFEEDSAITITGNGSFRFFAPADKDASVSIASAPLPAVPNAAYELSGWVKSLAIYGSGYGVVSIFEDDGNWGKGRTTDVRAMDETSGWQLFRKTITTLPTTRRLFVKMGLYKTYGTFWVDGIQLIKVDPNLPQPQPKLPPCK